MGLIEFFIPSFVCSINKTCFFSFWKYINVPKARLHFHIGNWSGGDEVQSLLITVIRYFAYSYNVVTPTQTTIESFFRRPTKSYTVNPPVRNHLTISQSRFWEIVSFLLVGNCSPKTGRNPHFCCKYERLLDFCKKKMYGRFWSTFFSCSY